MSQNGRCTEWVSSDGNDSELYDVWTNYRFVYVPHLLQRRVVSLRNWLYPFLHFLFNKRERGSLVKQESTIPQTPETFY